MIVVAITHHDGRRDVARPIVQVFSNACGRSQAVDALPAMRELQQRMLAPPPAAIASFGFLLGPPFNVILGTALAFLALWLVRAWT